MALLQLFPCGWWLSPAPPPPIASKRKVQEVPRWGVSVDLDGSVLNESAPKSRCVTSLCSLFILSSCKVKASLTCAVWCWWRHRADRRHELLVVWCRVFDSPQTHLQPDVRWSGITREAENEITSYSANQKTLLPPWFYFGAAKLLFGESRPDSMRKQPFLISPGIVAARSKWIDDPITTRCLRSVACSVRQATWQRSPLTFPVNSWKRMTLAACLQIPLPMTPCSSAAKGYCLV